MTDSEIIDMDNYPKTPLRAIRAKCLDCSCGSANEVKLCPCTNCPLYPYRAGRNPYRSRAMSEESKIKARERLALAREKAKANREAKVVDSITDV